jgi:ribulose-phosphate 3-epimerase
VAMARSPASAIGRLFDARVRRAWSFTAYRYRFLFTYVAIGIASLVVEALVRRATGRAGLVEPYAAALGVTVGILFAFWGNVRFNFRVPAPKRRRAFAYFAFISCCSWGLQFLLRRPIAAWRLSYEEARFLLSGTAFSLAYLLHRRFSFADYKKVAVAVYANGIEDIASIHAKIDGFADIIHVDLVDATRGSETHEVRTYRLEVVRAYWPHQPIHAHVMSRLPLRYLDDLVKYVDRVYVHADIDEDLADVLRRIRAAGREAGLVVTLETPLAEVRRHMADIDGLLFFSVAELGASGQTFQRAVCERIADVDRWPERARIDLCVDGGINETNVGLLNVEIVVSGSSVLTHPNPRRQIMRLQTSSHYERV